MAKKVCMDDLPEWSGNVLQGLAYWIGYKKQHYRFYPIREGEIVGETLGLLSSKLDNNLRLNAEVMFKDMCDKWKGNGRADIVISSKRKENFDYKTDVRYIIEVKRRESNKNEIEKDLKRLAKFSETTKNKNVRCFILLVSQDKRPDKYVRKDGNADTNNIPIDDSLAYVARVRQVKKALDKFFAFTIGKDKKKKKTTNVTNKAHYVCLIEVVKKCNIEEN